MDIKEISKFFGLSQEETKQLINENNWRIEDEGSYLKTIDVYVKKGTTKTVKVIVIPAAPGYFEVYIDKKGNVYYQDYISKAYYDMKFIKIQLVLEKDGSLGYHPVAIDTQNEIDFMANLLVELEKEVEEHGVTILDPLTKRQLRMVNNYSDLLLDLEEGRVILTRDGKCYSNIIEYNGEKWLLKEFLNFVGAIAKHINDYIDPVFSSKVVS